LEYVERYDQILETKLSPNSGMDKRCSALEKDFQAIIETIL
jgi:hypothetical protein